MIFGTVVDFVCITILIVVSLFCLAMLYTASELIDKIAQVGMIIASGIAIAGFKSSIWWLLLIAGALFVSTLLFQKIAAGYVFRKRLREIQLKNRSD